MLAAVGINDSGILGENKKPVTKFVFGLSIGFQNGMS